MNWEAVIGLEVHVQLATVSKIFSGASTAFGAPPNTQACAIDLAMPGTLPVFNAAALRMAVSFGLAIGAQIGKRSVFDRKNYFYPDLPKGYQISQMDHPVVGNGRLEIVLRDGSLKTVRITRAHLEEDAGKSLHEDFQDMTGIDLNRAGTPLLEIVSEPDLRGAEEAVAYLKALHGLVTDLGVCDGNMAEGSMRFDINLSIRPSGSDELGTRTETKNVNSFKFAERAIRYEFQRQIEVLESGGRVVQETRLYDAEKDETRSMRSKEVAHDYRYFPEPDLLPVVIDDAYIESVRASLPLLRPARESRLKERYGLGDYDARLLASTREISDFYALVADTSGAFKTSANWINVELMARLNKGDIEISDSPVGAVALGKLIQRIEDGTISGKTAKAVFDAMWDGDGDPDTIIAARGLTQLSDAAALESMVQDVLRANPGQVELYRTAPDNKRKKLLGFFIGQIMQASKGKANPQQVNAILLRHLDGHHE